MPVIVSLLRGVNVGGRQVKMDALREVYESLGLRRVETFIQSGNVVFATAARDQAKLTRRIEAAIEKRFGFACDVVLRTSAELRETLARNPFDGRPDLDPARLLVTFLAAEPSPEGCATVRAMKIEPEELRIQGRDVYIYFPGGIGQSKLSWTAIAKCLKTAGTGRNLTTVRKLLALAERLEAE